MTGRFATTTAPSKPELPNQTRCIFRLFKADPGIWIKAEFLTTD